MGAALGGVVLALGVAAPVLGATFTVNSTADSTDGSCGSAAGECTLREAIEAAVATPGLDTIGFDGAVFVPGPDPVRIMLASELPVVADAAGTAVTGAGASVRIDGGGAVANGLVFASAPGVPLGKVTVANLTVRGFTNHGVHVCGGIPPVCDADVSGALVRNVVAVESGASGILIEGRVNLRPRVIDSVAFESGGSGIRLQGNPSMIGARVEGSTASRSGGRGIWLLADRQTGSVVVDSFGLKSADDGIALTDDGATVEPRIGNVVAYANGNGVAMFNAELVEPTISNAVATANTGRGFVLSASTATAAALTRVVADSNESHGIFLGGSGRGARIVRALAVGNAESGIHSEAETGLTMTGVTAAANYGGIRLSAADSTVDRTNSSGNYYGSGVAIETAGGNTVTESSTLANGTYAFGVSIDEGSSGNTVEGNVALGNLVDLFDENEDCGGNAWSDNVFFSGSEPCVH
jgi:CSLREA domain-containing protein